VACSHLVLKKQTCNPLSSELLRQDALLEITGGRSVPRVFVAGNFIGGGDDTAAKAANGQLKLLLTDAGFELAA
jgi:glutaredoxin-related protein